MTVKKSKETSSVFVPYGGGGEDSWFFWIGVIDTTVRTFGHTIGKPWFRIAAFYSFLPA